MSEWIRSSARRRVAIAALMLGVILALAGELRAQTAEEYRQRVERLLPQWRAAVAAERTARHALEPEAVRAGALTLLVRPGEAAFAAEVAEVAWRRLAPRLGSDTALLAGERVQLVGPEDERPADWVSDEYPAVRVAELEDASAAASRVVHKLGRRLALRLEAATARWLGGEVPLVPASTPRLEGIYVELATADSRSARACVTGAVDACRDALGLVGEADALTVWYVPEQLRRRVGERSHPRALRGRAGRCVKGRDPAACLEVLRQYPAYGLAPLSQSSHRVLARLALERGGDGAYTRFLAPEASGIEARLRQASGVPLDSLIAAWRATVLANRPERTPAGVRLALTTLVWVAVLAFMATRSTRWRSG